MYLLYRNKCTPSCCTAIQKHASLYSDTCAGKRAHPYNMKVQACTSVIQLQGVAIYYRQGVIAQANVDTQHLGLLEKVGLHQAKN